MSERETLSAILNDEVSAPEPTDGSPPESVSADISGDAGDDSSLSPEEHIAEALRVGLDDDEDDSDGDPDESGARADPDHLRALANEAMQWRTWKATEDARLAETRVLSQAENRIAAAEAHYTREQARLLEDMEQDAFNAPDPDAYKRAHRDAIVRSVRAAERAWINGIAEETRTTVQAVRDHSAKPLAAEKLAREKGLPPEAVPRLMVANDIRQMFLIADLLVENRDAHQRTLSSAQQQVAEELARSVRANNVHPGSTGRSRASKPYQYVGSGEAGIRELKTLLNT